MKSSISESSPYFFSIVKNVKVEQLKSLPFNIQFTIWKYFNRAKHRSTPFGTFAAVSVCPVGQTNKEGIVNVDRKLKVHRFADWKSKEHIEFDFQAILLKDAELFTNSTYYPFLDHIRYISFNDGKFVISEVEPDDFMWALLKICAKPTPIYKIREQLLPLCEDEEDLLEKLEALIGLQLIFTSLDANITGQDYFERMELSNSGSEIQYIISERDCIGGVFPQKILQHVEEMYHFLARNAAVTENERLNAFVTRFRQKYESQEIPIMVALDPEIGIGYANMEESDDTDEFILKLSSNKNGNQHDHLTIKKQLLNSLSVDNGTVYLDKLALTDKFAKLIIFPNTFNFLFSEVDGLVVVEHIGGVTATALAGRFTLASEPIQSFAKEIVKIEQLANPGVLFFDLAYTGEAEVDNVNRRSHIYDYQLSLFNFDTSDTPLTANDIMVSIKDNQVILRSESMNIRLVPRLSSAYNHSRSDLPIFRILCDLQDQGLLCNFLVKPDQHFPEFNQYPRIQFKNIILSPRKWRITTENLSNFNQYLVNNKIAKDIRVGVDDQMLYFNLHEDNDLKMLIHFVKTKKELLIEEAFIPERCRVKDKKGNGFAAQYMATYYHREQIYEPYRIAEDPKCESQRCFLPGQDWLYFEIFCHPGQMDNLLCGAIHQFINQHEDSLNKWFFIRYDEGGPHIRLRLKPDSPLDNNHFLNKIMALLKPYFDQGTVSDISLRAYVRELERYGPELIDDIESHFANDSKIVLGILENDFSIQHRYTWSVLLFEKILDLGIEGIGNVGYFTQTILQSLQNEHKISASDFKQLNKEYKDFSTAATSRIDSKALDALVDSFSIILDKGLEERRNNLLIDLFHMHINRLFPSYQRTHEMVIYYYLDKMEKTAISKRKEPAAI